MILCFSEDADRLARLGEKLQAAGYHVFLCLDARDAVRVLTQEKIDVIIGDDALRSEAGQKLYDQALAFYPPIPIILWVERSPISPLNFDPDAIVPQSQGIDGLSKAITNLTRDDQKFANGTS